ncbi:MAG: hypothetical protein HDR31_02405 [Mycoplasma sp.]|nr:hypothetical protein [Mycoplasma sp.]
MHDQELIYLVNECHNKQAFQILYSKYFETTSLMGQWKVFKTFYNLPLEKDDLITEAYFSFFKSY